MSCQVVLKVRNSSTKWGESVGVVGETPALGNWSSPILLTGTAYPEWVAVLKNVAQGQRFEYKYVIVQDGSIKSWENDGSSRNRSFVAEDELEVDDGYFGLAKDSNVSVQKSSQKAGNEQRKDSQSTVTAKSKAAKEDSGSRIDETVSGQRVPCEIIAESTQSISRQEEYSRDNMAASNSLRSRASEIGESENSSHDSGHHDDLSRCAGRALMQSLARTKATYKLLREARASISGRRVAENKNLDCDFISDNVEHACNVEITDSEAMRLAKRAISETARKMDNVVTLMRHGRKPTASQIREARVSWWTVFFSCLAVGVIVAATQSLEPYSLHDLRA